MKMTIKCKKTNFLGDMVDFGDLWGTVAPIIRCRVTLRWPRYNLGFCTFKFIISGNLSEIKFCNKIVRNIFHILISQDSEDFNSC
jgi:hypothetical protein